MDLYLSYVHLLGIPLTTIVTAAGVLVSVIYYWLKNRKVLPGPTGVPYLGIYPFLNDENCHLKLEEYKKKYGDLFSFTVTGRLYINLGSIKAMREIHLQNSEYFLDKPKDWNLFNVIAGNGILLINGGPWKVIRKFFVQKFKEYGLNAVRDNLAGPVYDSLNALIGDLKALRGKPVNVVEFLSKHCETAMRKVLFGETGVTDQEISQILTVFAKALEGNGMISTLLIGPLAKCLFCVKPSFRRNIKNTNVGMKIILDCVKRIELSMTEGEATCIVEEFYKERDQRRRNKDPSWEFFSDKVLVESLFQFVGDGISTMAAFVAGLLNAILQHPEEQEKIYSEIMDVIGPNRQPTIEDRPHLAYTNAFLNEYCRSSQFLNFFPSSECTKEVTIRGYRIPKGAIALYNFWSANHDPETFEDPYTFRPSRYLHVQGKPKVETPVLFGMGKRVCTGEPYVMLQSFLFLTTIIKYFRVVSSNAPNEETYAFLLAGKLELTFVPRKDK